MNPALIELIILAGIAVFLFLRLRSVLGTREGFEKPRMQPKNDAPKRDFKVIDGGEDKDITDILLNHFNKHIKYENRSN